MALREIRKEGDDILRKKSRTVEKIDEKILNLLDDLAQTLYHEKGAGLAAPQVGVLKKVVVVDIGEGLIELINPEIIASSGSEIEAEGCLSIPGVWGKVERPSIVEVKALDRDGKERIYKGEGYLARAFCHEIDHLDGKLFVDKVISYIDPKEL